MCGILGSISNENLNIERCIDSLKLLSHRGPDYSSYKIHLNSHFFIGHTRLKIIDLSNDANQPFVSNCGGYEIVFNGEIFNYKEIIKNHKNLSFCRTNSDTEVLLNLYILYGSKMLDFINGMFAFAIYDKKKGNLFLARDRFGIKPLYYIHDQNNFYFSSEIKPLILLNGKSSPNNKMISTYLKTSFCDFSKYTFFKSILQLEAGSYMDINLENLSIKTKNWYGVQNLLKNNSENNVDKISSLDSIFKKSINLHCISDVEIGLNISGGVDSSLLISYIKNTLGKFNTFTQDFENFSEKYWVEKLINSEFINSNILNIKYTDILSNLQNTIRHQEQPFGGVAVVGYSILYELAKKLGIKVLLDGNGIDEVFLGYKKYHLQYLVDQKNSSNINGLIDEYCKFWNTDKNYLNKKLKDFNSSSAYIDGSHHSGKNCISEDLYKLNSYEIPKINIFEDNVRNNAAEDLFFTKIPRGLRFNDRMSMMHSCELRVPFLDHKIVEYAYNLPVEDLINQFGTKSIVRKVLSKYVKKEIAYAPKRSIQTPQNDWLSKELKPLVLDVINSKSFNERGWFKTRVVAQTYEDYLSSNKSSSFFIWQWLNLELWAREFFD